METLALLRQQIELGRDQQDRRQAPEIGERRAGPGVEVIRLVAQVVAPEAFHFVGGEHVPGTAQAPDGLGRGAPGEDTVIEQQPADRTQSAPFAQVESGRESQVGAGRIAADRQPAGVDPQFGAALGEKLHSCLHLRESQRELRLRGQTRSRRRPR